MVREDSFGIDPMGIDGKVSWTCLTQEAQGFTPFGLSDNKAGCMTGGTGVFFSYTPFMHSLVQ